MEMINARDIVCIREGSGTKVIDGLSLTLEKGELLFVLGASGSGKTSLVLALCGLLPLSGGSITLGGMELADKSERKKIRKLCSAVLDEPAEQLIAEHVVDDVAFGVQNILDSTENIEVRISDALSAVGLSGYEKRATELLTSGEKRRVALAGLLACEIEIIIIDGLGSPSDPTEKKAFISIIEKLHRQGKSIIVFSDDAEDASIADRVMLISKGRMLAQGRPEEILSDDALLQKAGLLPPFTLRVYKDLMAAEAGLESFPLDIEELVDEICR